ncbi:hypothetical protein J6590_077441 [Homalodisca vitripennis]|nr:hypothetical protein J6590_077441 [Homalodisca vitripennis]
MGVAANSLADTLPPNRTQSGAVSGFGLATGGPSARELPEHVQTVLKDKLGLTRRPPDLERRMDRGRRGSRTMCIVMSGGNSNRSQQERREAAIMLSPRVGESHVFISRSQNKPRVGAAAAVVGNFSSPRVLIRQLLSPMAGPSLDRVDENLRRFFYVYPGRRLDRCTLCSSCPVSKSLPLDHLPHARGPSKDQRMLDFQLSALGMGTKKPTFPWK